MNVNFFPYAFGGKKGIGCGLGPVQKLRDGEVLGGGRVSAAQAFGTPIPQQPTGGTAPSTPTYGTPIPQQSAGTVPGAPVYGVAGIPAQAAQPAAQIPTGGVDPITGLPC